MDCDVNMQHEPPVRKISMTLLLNDPKEFEGGDLELMAPGKFAELKQGHAICFASFLNHRVNKVRRGVRQSLVVWFGGKPFR
jgi:PKHD-type hydroxylase